MSERHIAREGETEFAAIMRNRSGVDSGNIDYGLRTGLVAELSDAEKQDICNTAFALYRSVCWTTGKKAEQDQPQ